MTCTTVSCTVVAERWIGVLICTVGGGAMGGYCSIGSEKIEARRPA